MKDTAPLPQYVAGHYRVESLLGIGGMSRVLAVLDERDGRRLALKQLVQTERVPRHPRTLALFRQEFHVLTQIAHPNVVAVDEYGFDGDQPFYTMELVVGDPVDQLAPLGWQALCAILLDLCSPLSLLHARRFVHADITARNVLVTERGVAKLIDFGALTPTDEPTNTIAGTPPYISPELAHRLLLDGRVDIYALGALAYFALSGRHAYPARSLRELEAAWAVPACSLTELGVDVPAALDDLVLSMLSLDRAARPMQIAEVVQRVCAITGDTTRDLGAISAHAATPELVGREPVLEAFRQLHEGAARGEGELMFIAGPKGMGSSRALDACALESRLSGSLVLRASAKHAAGGEYGVFANVLLSALRQDPELATALSIDPARPDIEHELAKLLADDGARKLLPVWWDELTAQRTTVVLVDDLTRADPPSVQQLLLLAEASQRRRLLIVASIGAGDSPLERNLRGMRRTGRTIRLRALSATETELLLHSMFGDMPQLPALAAWVHGASGGVPAACVELAHYVIERGVVHYRAGQFQLATDLDLVELPRGYDDAITARIRTLGDRAREALGALSLLTPFGALTAPEHAELLCYAGWSQAEALAALDELLDAQLLKQGADGYELHSEAVRRTAQTELGVAAARSWHERIGCLYQSRGHARSMLAALHLEYGGERERAYAELLAVDANITGPDDPNVPVGGSAAGIALHQTMLQHAVAKQSRQEIIHFRRVLLELAATSNPSLATDGLDLLQQLRVDAGLDRWDDASADLDERHRLLLCLARGQERYLELPVEQRGVPVRDAVRMLAQSAAVLAASCTFTFDRATAAELVRLFEPLRTLSPVLGVTYAMLENSRLALSRGGRMTERWCEVLSMLETRPEGMRELIWRYMVSNHQCQIAREAAAAGDDRCVELTEPLTHLRRRQRQVLSLQLLYALARGSFEESKRLRRELEIAAVSSGHEDQLVAFAHIVEIELLEACGDLLELQRLSSWFDARARRYPGWMPFAAIARAACFLLCEQPGSAEAVLTEQLDAAPVLEHAAWYALRALRAEAIWLAGDAEQARQLAEELLQQAAAAGLDMSPNIRAQRVLALTSAKLGDSQGAIDVLSPMLAAAEISSSVSAGQVFEARARVALVCRDRAEYARCVAQVQGLYTAGGYPGLLTKLERLQAAGRRAFERSTSTAKLSAVRKPEPFTSPYAAVEAELDLLTPRERAAYLLSLLMADSKSSGGKLYRVGTGGSITLLNAHADAFDDSVLEHSLAEYVSHLTALDQETTRYETSGECATISLTTRGIPHAAVPLRDRTGTLCGVALLRSDGAQLACAPALCRMVADALARF